MTSKSRHHKLVIQFVEYMVSGGVYFWVGYGAFALTWSFFGWSLWWAKLTANIIGWTANFLMQRYWVFKNPELTDHQTQVTGRYIFITLVDFVLDYLIVAGLKQMGLTPYLGQFISAGFFTGWNYFWYRFWVFPDKVDKGKFKLTLARLFTHRPHGHSVYKKA